MTPSPFGLQNVWWVAATLTASGLAARHLTARIALPDGGRAERLLAFGPLFVVLVLLSVQLPAVATLLTGQPLVRPLPIALAAGSLWLAVHLGCRSGRHAKPQMESVPGRGLGRRLRKLWFIWLPIAALFAAFALRTLTGPPLTFDGCFYRLPTVVRWWRDGALDLYLGIWQLGLTGNGELWELLLVSLGLERLIELGMAPFGLLLALVVYALARRLGVPRRAALPGAVGVLGLPIVAGQMFGSMVDLFATTFVLVSAYWLFRKPQTPRTRWACVGLAGLSAGIALGTKLTNAYWVFLLAATGLLVWRFGWRARRRELWRAAAVFSLAAVLPAGFWPLRAAGITGWPLYPLKPSLGGVALGAGTAVDDLRTIAVENSLGALGYPWFETKSGGYPYGVDNGLGAAYAVLVPAGLIWYAWRVRPWRRSPDRVSRASAALLVLGGALLLVTAYYNCPRYVLPIWILAYVLALPALALAMRYRRRCALALVAVTTWWTAAATGLAPATIALDRIARGDFGRASAYELPTIVDALPPGAVVLNLASCSNNYPLLGASLRNTVLESMPHVDWGLPLPLRWPALARHHVEYVYCRGRGEPPFAPDVDFTTIFDDTDSAARRATTAPTRIFRVLGSRASHNLTARQGPQPR